MIKKKLPLNKRKEISNWIADRQGLKGAYADMLPRPEAIQRNKIIYR
ncbi:MAG: hypothetical protein M3R36_18110 [Bacteroidota bacterium]|nr:hypothetical protein [Bacteroidota bacterium]